MASMASPINPVPTPLSTQPVTDLLKKQITQSETDAKTQKIGLIIFAAIAAAAVLAVFAVLAAWFIVPLASTMAIGLIIAASVTTVAATIPLVHYAVQFQKAKKTTSILQKRYQNEINPTPCGHCQRLRDVPIEKAMEKMHKNARKAIEEHRGRKHDSAYATAAQALPSIEELRNSPANAASLNFSHHFHDAQGPRTTMEDAHFFKDIDQGAVVAVFDGHGGKEVADYANTQFQLRFAQKLALYNGNVHKSFERLIHEIHTEVLTHQDWNGMGCTAVISFIDKKSGNVYTATLGDSESNIYRQCDDGLKSIPLSCVRDWSSQKDAKRAAIATGVPELETEWPKYPDQSKTFRYNNLNSIYNYVRHQVDKIVRWYSGVNVSRAIGDAGCNGTSDKPGVIHKPKITVTKARPGDRLVIACDGLKDYVPENEIVDVVKANPGNNLAQALVDKALSNMSYGGDNVTVVVVEIS